MPSTAFNRQFTFTLNGGAGFDIAVVTGSQGVSLDMFHAGLEAAIGGEGDDRLHITGTARAVLAGQGGNDLLVTIGDDWW